MIKKILVSQPKPTSEKSPYFDIANKFGVELVFRPFIKVDPISSKDFRAQKVCFQAISVILIHMCLVRMASLATAASVSRRFFILYYFTELYWISISTAKRSENRQCPFLFAVVREKIIFRVICE